MMERLTEPEHQSTPHTKQRRPRKEWKDMTGAEKFTGITVLVIGVFIVLWALGATISAIGRSISAQPSAATNSQQSQAQTAIDTTQHQAAASQQTVAKATPSTLDQLWTALDNSGQDRNSVHIDYLDPSQTAEGYGGLVHFSRDDLNPWDSKTFVQDFLTHFVRYGQQAFKIPNVDHLDFTVNTSFIDDHGNTTTDTGMEIRMSKTSFNSFNWQNLEGTPVYEAIVGSSDYNYLAPAISRNVDTSKVILLLN